MLRSSVWSKSVFACLLALCLLLIACTGAGPAETKADIRLSVPESTVASVNGETSESRYTVSQVLERSDGLYEVHCRRLTEGSDESDHVRCLYMADGTPIGYREERADQSGQDTFYLFDTKKDSYLAGVKEKIDRVEEDRIYYLDGTYEDLELVGDRITHIDTYSAEGGKSMEFRINDLGQMEVLKIYTEGGEATVDVRNTYQTVTP